MIEGGGQVYTDIQGLAQLKRKAKDDYEGALREVAEHFESVFLQMMLKSMRDANLGEGMFDSDQSRMYQDMFDKQVAVDLARNKGIGLADLLVRQLNPEAAAGEESGAPSSFKMTPLGPLPVPQRAPSAANGTGGFHVESPDDFVRQLWPHAQRVAKELNVKPQVLIAQAALETGWGERVMPRSDGNSSFNLFGIKADARWQGATVESDTHEYEGGQRVTRHDVFRAYDGLRQAFDDYVALVRDNPRYRAALTADGPEYAAALQAGGYATDPNYASKINEIAAGDRLASALTGLNP